MWVTWCDNYKLYRYALSTLELAVRPLCECPKRSIFWGPYWTTGSDMKSSSKWVKINAISPDLNLTTLEWSRHWEGHSTSRPASTESPIRTSRPTHTRSWCLPRVIGPEDCRQSSCISDLNSEVVWCAVDFYPSEVHDVVSVLQERASEFVPGTTQRSDSTKRLNLGLRPHADEPYQAGRRQTCQAGVKVFSCV